ncbi:MAG: ribosomal protein S18-alanine N-acetyltransferase [Clostridiales bacterium]|nr:ribosomal protein S18-alanine N-acetyltransferase [Clostridiales bacterium]
MSLILNEMTENDLDEVISISDLSLSVEAWSHKSFHEELNNPLAKYIVAKINNNVIGFAGLWLIGDEGHISNIAVHPNYRKQGVGKELIKSLLLHKKKWNLTSLTLEVRESNFIAKHLYKEFGFKEEGIRKNYYSDNNENAIIMWHR